MKKLIEKIKTLFLAFVAFVFAVLTFPPLSGFVAWTLTSVYVFITFIIEPGRLYGFNGFPLTEAVFLGLFVGIVVMVMHSIFVLIFMTIRERILKPSTKKLIT